MFSKVRRLAFLVLLSILVWQSLGFSPHIPHFLGRPSSYRMKDSPRLGLVRADATRGRHREDLSTGPLIRQVYVDFDAKNERAIESLTRAIDRFGDNQKEDIAKLKGKMDSIIKDKKEDNAKLESKVDRIIKDEKEGRAQLESKLESKLDNVGARVGALEKTFGESQAMRNLAAAIFTSVVAIAGIVVPLFGDKIKQWIK